MLISVGLVTAVAARTAASAPVALAASAVLVSLPTPLPVPDGTDVSSANGSSINWAGVAGSMRFAAVKATEGDYYTDPDYSADVTKAAAAGLYVMPYVFANPYPGNGTGTAQADYAWNKEIGKVTDPAYRSSARMLPVAVDLEPDPYAAQEKNGNQCYDLSPASMVTWIRDFISAAKADSGKTPVIYTTTAWWDACTADSKAFSEDPLWIASYGVTVPAIPSAWASLALWQYSQSGTVSGMSGAADLDSLGPTQAGPLNTAIPAEQVQTLTSLSSGATATGYRQSGLPPGVSMSSSGQIAGKPAAAGQYTVTITSPAGAVPPSMSFTWDVYGVITLAVASRSSAAGTPIWLKVPVSGPDRNAGAVPALSATGLPPGLSMTSAGVITGWASRPGRYEVAITAADALGGTGRTSFTWTVTAAAATGPAGPVRQAGGSGKCLNDPGGRVANGTRLNLWTCTGRPDQRWTSVQDGTLRTGGKCLATVGDRTASGAGLALAACDAADGAQHWVAGTDGQLVNPQSGMCLDVPVARAVNGTQPVIEPCARSAGQPNERWLRPAAAVTSGEPGKCLAVSRTAVVLAACANVAAQRWQPQPDGTVRVNGKCLVEGGATARSPLSAGPCSGAAGTWALIWAGPIATELVSAASGLCVSVPAAGTRLVIAPCASAPATTWRVG